MGSGLSSKSLIRPVLFKWPNLTMNSSLYQYLKFFLSALSGALFCIFLWMDLRSKSPQLQYQSIIFSHIFPKNCSSLLPYQQLLSKILSAIRAMFLPFLVRGNLKKNISGTLLNLFEALQAINEKKMWLGKLVNYIVSSTPSCNLRCPCMQRITEQVAQFYKILMHTDASQKLLGFLTCFIYFFDGRNKTTSSNFKITILFLLITKWYCL